MDTLAKRGGTTSTARCFHCGQAVPPGRRWTVVIEGTARPMCCPGCQAVAQAIVDAGMETFYRHRTTAQRNAGDLERELAELGVYDRPQVQARFVQTRSGSTRYADLILEGITCAACVWLNEQTVRRLPGVLEFHVNQTTQRARVRWDPNRIALSEILRAIARIGYRAHPYDPVRSAEVRARERRRLLTRVGVAGIGLMQLMIVAVALYLGDWTDLDADMRAFLRWVSLAIALPVLAYSAQPFFAGAVQGIRVGRLPMDVPVALAITIAACASIIAVWTQRGDLYFDSAVMFAFFLLTGRYLELAARQRAVERRDQRAAQSPLPAQRLREGGIEIVSADELAPGDRVLIRSGQVVPADGTIVEGRTQVDESLLTGESRPQPRAPGDTVIAGSVNLDGPIEVRVERSGGDTEWSLLDALLARAYRDRPPLQRFADRVASWFIAALLALATGVLAYWWQADPARALPILLSVLVVTCPCALSLAIPAALASATAALADRGILITRGAALETLARIDHVVLDKTGTVTEGRFRLDSVQSRDGVDADQALAWAAALEHGIDHPLARVFHAYWKPGHRASEWRSFPGLGVEAVVDGRRLRLGSRAFVAEFSRSPIGPIDPDDLRTWVVLGDTGGELARFALSDPIRAGAPELVAALQRAGCRITLLSGDRSAIAAAVAQRLGIAHHQGDVRPDQKLAVVRRLQAEGSVVAMIGDGANDAPGLAGAQVSIAFGAHAPLAAIAADVIVLDAQPGQILDALETARRTRRIVQQNLAWAAGYNLLAVPLAAAGWVAPWLAALGMSASSLIVVLNALRLRARAAAPVVAAPARARTV